MKTYWQILIVYGSELKSAQNTEETKQNSTEVKEIKCST